MDPLVNRQMGEGARPKPKHQSREEAEQASRLSEDLDRELRERLKSRDSGGRVHRALGVDPDERRR